MQNPCYTKDVPGVIQPFTRFPYDCVGEALLEKDIKRTTNLAAPIECLRTHTAEIFSCEFHPEGELLVSAGLRPEIHICSVFDESDIVMVMKGHWCAVMETHFSSDGTSVYSCSSDQTLATWDTFTGIRTGWLKNHVGCVNSMQCARRGLPMLCSGGDDHTVRIWDVRLPINAMTFEDSYNQMAVCFNDQADHIFAGGLNSVIKVWDIRMGVDVLQLVGHQEPITGLSLSPCGNFLLSNSLDNTMRIWDIRPTCTDERCIQVLPSNQKFVNGNLLRCAWSRDGTKVAAGSTDEDVTIYNVENSMVLDILPGHFGPVNDVDFHPTEQIVASASSDTCLMLHESLVW